MKMLALYSRYLKVKDAIKRRLTDEEGQTLVEYVLIDCVDCLGGINGNQSGHDMLCK